MITNSNGVFVLIYTPSISVFYLNTLGGNLRITYFNLSLYWAYARLLCFTMGQPTHGITQRVGKNQVWSQMFCSSVKETSYGENLFKLSLGMRLSTLFFLSLVLVPKTNMWLSSIATHRLFFSSKGWYAHYTNFPRLTTGLVVFSKYFEKTNARPLFRDGETTIFSLAYTHRRLRFQSLFWCQPRCFKLETSILVLLRACNVLQRRVRHNRVRSAKLRRVVKGLWLFSRPDKPTSSLEGWF